MFTEKRYQLVNSEIATLESANKETAALTVVFLHGWLDNSGSFLTLMKACQSLLPNARFVAIDLPGHGLSSHRGKDNYYLFHDYIDDLHQLVMALSPNRLVLVGHSLGALLATCYSAAFAENVSGLVQIEGYGPLSESAEKTVSRLRGGILSRQKNREKRVRCFSSLQEMLKVRMSVNRLTQEELMPIVQRGARETSNGWQWRHDPKLQTDSLVRMTEENAQSIRQSVACPQLVILGDSGFDYLAKLSEREEKTGLSSSERRLTVERIPGGHHCHLQQTELTSRLIYGLVNKI